MNSLLGVYYQNTCLGHSLCDDLQLRVKVCMQYLQLINGRLNEITESRWQKLKVV